MSEYKTIPIDEITVDDELQVRDFTRASKIEEYTLQIKDGAHFPPIHCGRLQGGDGTLYLVDGFHRLQAYVNAGVEQIDVEIAEYGTLWEMDEYALRVNKRHGINMTDDEVKARMYLIIQRYPAASEGVLAEKCGVSQPTIHRRIQELIQMNKLKRPEKIIGKDGKERPSTVARPTVPTDGPEYTLCPQCGTPIWPENMGNPDYTYTEQGGRLFCCPDCADEWESSQKSAAATDLTGIPETLPPMPSAALPTRPNPSLEPEHPARPVDPEPEETDPFAPSPEQTEDDENEAIAADLAFRLKNFRPQRINRILLILIDKLNININNIINAPRSKNSDLPDDEKTAFVWILNTGEEWTLKRSDLEKFKELYPGIDVEQELRNSIGWNLTNPKNRKTKTGILKHLNTWLSNSQNRAKVQPKAQRNGRKSGYVSRDAGLDFENLEY